MIIIMIVMLIVNNIQDKRKEAQQKTTYKSYVHKQASGDIAGTDDIWKWDWQVIHYALQSIFMAILHNP